jgi:hypothetical protein
MVNRGARMSVSMGPLLGQEIVSASDRDGRALGSCASWGTGRRSRVSALKPPWASRIGALISGDGGRTDLASSVRVTGSLSNA